MIYGRTAPDAQSPNERNKWKKERQETRMKMKE